MITESKQFVPSGYFGLNTADVLRGSRPQKYVEFLWTTDPLADAVMDEFAGLPEREWWALLKLALAKGLDAVPHCSRLLSLAETTRESKSPATWSTISAFSRAPDIRS